jgi:signal peptidase II
VAIVALAIDQLTKFLALRGLGSGQVYQIGLLRLRLLRNPGATLGLGSNFTWIIAVFAVVVSVAVIVVQLLRTRNMWWSLVLGLIFAGAFGNFLDRVIYAKGFLDGMVVDFIDYGWSVGNVADVFLTVAVIGLFILFIFAVPLKKPYSAKKADMLDDGFDDSEEDLDGRSDL